MSRQRKKRQKKASIEVECARNGNINDEEPRGSYVNSEGLRRSNRDQHQCTYTISTGQPGGYYEAGHQG